MVPDQENMVDAFIKFQQNFQIDILFDFLTIFMSFQKMCLFQPMQNDKLKIWVNFRDFYARLFVCELLTCAV